MMELEDDVEALVSGTLHDLVSGSGPVTLGLLDSLGWPELVDTYGDQMWGRFFEIQGSAVRETSVLGELLESLVTDSSDPNVVIALPTGSASGSAAIALGPVIATSSIVILDSERGTEASAPSRGGSRTTQNSSLDEGCGWTLVQFADGDGSSDWEGRTVSVELEALVHRLIGHELLGLAQQMSDVATTHVMGRSQFGQRLASFQAVQHRIAGALVAIRAARVGLHAAWRHDEPLLAAQLGRGLAWRAFREAAECAEQLTGALGYTWEFDLHRSVRRGFTVDLAWGPSTLIRRRMVRAWLDGAPLVPATVGIESQEARCR